MGGKIPGSGAVAVFGRAERDEEEKIGIDRSRSEGRE